MQVFLTNSDFAISAMELDNIRLNKQITEINQILLSYVNSGKNVGHENHPVNIWYKSNRGIQFLLKYLYYLTEEYRFRKNKIHMGHFTYKGLYDYFYSTHDVFDGDDLIHIFDEDNPNFKPAYIKGSGINQIITTENIYQLYQNLLIDKWNNDYPTPKWTNRKAPIWYQDYFDKLLEW